MSREALKLALEALEASDDTSDATLDAMHALREALAQEQGLFVDLIAKHKGLAEELAKMDLEPQPEQKPVAWMYTSQWKGNERFITRYQTELKTYKADEVWPLYTSPPQRGWVGLTGEELADLYNQKTWDVNYSWEYERAIEAQLKERNA